MSKSDIARRAAGPAIAALALALATPGGARAQFSAIGAVSTGNILGDAPIFSQSALVLDRGGVSVGGNGLFVGFDEEEVGLTEGVDVSAFQLSGGLAFGLTDRLTVGITVPWARATAEFEGEEEDASGLLDTDIYGRYQFWRSADERTRLAGLAGVTLKTASGDFEVEGLDEDPDFDVGAAVSHALDRATLHGAVGYTLAGGGEFEGVEFEGVDVLSVSGAAVFAASETFKASGEVGVDVPDEGDTAFSIAGGLRYLASSNLFLDAGIILPVSESAVTYGALLGLTWTR